MATRTFGEPGITFGESDYTFGYTEKFVSSSTPVGKDSGLFVLVKLYENQRSTTPYVQIFVEDEVKISQDIQTYDITNLTIQNVNGLAEDNKIEIFEANRSGPDVKKFSGFIFQLEPSFQQLSKIAITARSEKAIMEKRLMLTPINFYDVNRKLSAVPVYSASWGINEKILSGNTIYTNTGTIVPESGSPSYTYTSEVLVDLSYVYVETDDNLWKYDGSLTDLGNVDGIPAKDFIEEMLDDYNISYGDDRSVESSVNTKLRTNRQIGDNIYGIIDEIANEAGVFWDIQDGVINFKTLLGVDRTTGSEYEEIFFDGYNPQSGNIKDIKLIGQATSTTILAYKDQRGKVEIDTSNYSGFVAGVGFKEFRDGNLSDKVTNYLSTAALPQRTYQVEVEQNSINANIGDKVKMIVENTNTYFNINTDTIVSNKEITYNQGKTETFGLQEFNIQQFTDTNRARAIQKNIKLLQI